jgi:dGTPase
VNHDIDDAIRAGVLPKELPPGPTEVLGHNHGARITTMVTTMMVSLGRSRRDPMSREVWDAMMELRAFLFDNVYLGEEAKAEEPKAYRVVRRSSYHYLENPFRSADGVPCGSTRRTCPGR